MSYRDDSDALREKLALRERELAEAKRRIAELEAPAEGSSKPNWFLGAPSKIDLRDTIEGEVSEETLEKIVRLLRSEFGELGRLDRVGKMLAWSLMNPQTGRGVEVTIDVTGGQTLVQMRERLGNVAGGVFGGLMGGLGGGGVGGIVAASIAAGITPGGIPLIVVGWFGAVYLGARGLYGRIARGREKKLRKTFAKLELLLREDAKQRGAKVRVEAEAEPDGAETLAEAEELPDIDEEPEEEKEA